MKFDFCSWQQTIYTHTGTSCGKLEQQFVKKKKKKKDCWLFVLCLGGGELHPTSCHLTLVPIFEPELFPLLRLKWNLAPPIYPSKKYLKTNNLHTIWLHLLIILRLKTHQFKIPPNQLSRSHMTQYHCGYCIVNWSTVESTLRIRCSDCIQGSSYHNSCSVLSK